VAVVILHVHKYIYIKKEEEEEGGKER